MLRTKFAQLLQSLIATYCEIYCKHKPEVRVCSINTTEPCGFARAYNELNDEIMRNKT